MEITVRVSKRGPIFGVNGPRVVHSGIVAIVDEVSDKAYTTVKSNLASSIRIRTPFYETQIRDRAISDLSHTVYDNRVIYGPWLEGTGSKNATTRFKGYRSFRRAHATVEAQAGAQAQQIMIRYVRRLQ